MLQVGGHLDLGQEAVAAKDGGELGVEDLDGNLAAVRSTLQPALLDAERETGRRGMVACMYAPVLAAAARDGGDPELAMALLADRRRQAAS